MTIAIQHKPRGTTYQARLKEPGGKYHRYTFSTLEAAKAWHKGAEVALRDGLPIPSPSAMVGVTLQSLAQRYVTTLWPQQNAQVILGQFDKIAECLPESVAKDIPSISTRALLCFVEARKAMGSKPATIKHNLSRLRSLLKHSVDMGDIPGDTLEGVQWPKSKGSDSRYRFLTEEEEQALLEGLGSRDHQELTKFLIDTGCRPGEVLNTQAYVAKPFTWRDVTVTPQGRGLVTLWDTKTGTARTVPLTQAAQGILEDRRERGEPGPFLALSYSQFRKDVVDTATRLGMSDVVVYTFRHTCATRLVQRGADIRRVQVWMGHSNIQTTLRYAKLVPQDIYSLADIL